MSDRPAGRVAWSAAGAAALGPAWLVVIAAYGWSLIWALRLSFTSATLLPHGKYVGLRHYRHIWTVPRWVVSLENLAIFGVLFMAGALLLGLALAVALDRKVRFEGAFRTIFLYPYALSFIVTGLVWQWLFDPGLGIQNAVRQWGWHGFTLDWTTRPAMAIYAIALAGIWQVSGLVMVIMLAGLRGVDGEIWHAARVEGIPTWRTYVSIVLPMLGPSFATCFLLLSMGLLRVYDLVVALTNGGPGISSEVPAKFVMDELFGRHNVGEASAAAMVLLLFAVAGMVPGFWRARRAARER